MLFSREAQEIFYGRQNFTRLPNFMIPLIMFGVFQEGLEKSMVHFFSIYYFFNFVVFSIYYMDPHDVRR